jgi:hypothetical protein
MNIIDDLSYSNLVNIIQGEDIKAADVLHSCANELEEIRSQIIETETNLIKLKSRENSLIQASQNVMKHIKKEPPLIVQRSGYVVVVYDNNVLIERNVI